MVKRQAVDHQIIMASAGTGKTYSLTGRIIRLLTHAVPLERIVALTFTRAAAGEIFDTLVKRLAEAARMPRKDDELQALGLPLDGSISADVTTLLRDVIARMHLSPIGTLDSFFVKMVRLFPFEFSVAGDFGILEGYALKLEIQRVLRHILVADRQPGERSLHGFLEAFKRATFGAEEKRLHELLEQFVSNYHELYLNAAAFEAWGDAGRIWKDRDCWWTRCDERTLAATVQAFREGVLGLDPTDKQLERWEDFLRMVECFEPGSLITSPGDDLLKKLLASLDELRMGAAEITVQRRKMQLPPALCALAVDLVGHVVACAIAGRLESTAGLRDILASYEETYDILVRRSGRMAFSDVTHLVTRGIDAGARLNVDFRLDGHYDHWAIDEFQDTSRQQWHAVRALVEEVIQDPEGRRSFFAVGDVKQAIYGWRGGDSRLLSEIRDYYGIPEKALTESYRCGPAVIAAVNQVFADLRQVGLPDAVVERWHESWRPHRSAKSGQPGCCRLLEVQPGPGSRSVTDTDWHACIATSLHEVSPWSRGLSAAVLVRSNDQGKKLTEALRAQGIPTVWTGDKGIADNPVVAAFLDIFRVAEHPGDTFSWHHLCMTPLLQAAGPQDGRDPGRLAQSVLRDVHTRGFAFTVEQWLMRLEALQPLDAFSCQRLQALLGAAEAFDRTGSLSCLDFADFVEAYSVADIAADRTVQIMTIHRSKGLGFDIVLVPLFRGAQGLDSIGSQEVLLGPRAPGETAHPWLMLSPTKEVALADSTMAEALARASETACFEELCVLYVAMTRAKRALDLFVPTPPKKPGRVHLHTLVRHQFTGTAGPSDALPLSLGDPDWFRAVPDVAPPATEKTEPEERLAEWSVQSRRHRRRTPSGHQLAGRSAAELFRAVTAGGFRFGSHLHALFEEIEWLDRESVDAAVARWRTSSTRPATLADAVESVVRRALACPEVARELSHPGRPCSLWRERSFELILDDEWVSGTFDRVVILRAADGRAEAARIVDYKSDRISQEGALAEAVERYREQLRIYRRALSVLLDLSEERISARLLFTDVAELVAV